MVAHSLAICKSDRVKNSGNKSNIGSNGLNLVQSQCNLAPGRSDGVENTGKQSHNKCFFLILQFDEISSHGLNLIQIQSISQECFTTGLRTPKEHQNTCFFRIVQCDQISSTGFVQLGSKSKHHPNNETCRALLLHKLEIYLVSTPQIRQTEVLSINCFRIGFHGQE